VNAKTKPMYPEHEKLQKVHEQSQAIGDFLEWLQSIKRVHLHVWLDEQTEYEAICPGEWGTGCEEGRAVSFVTGADRGECGKCDGTGTVTVRERKIDEEKDQMLRDIRAANA
jgi:hypothetical protein